MKAETGWSMEQENNDTRGSLIETKRAETFLKGRSYSEGQMLQKNQLPQGFQFSTGLESRRSLLLLGRASSMKDMLEAREHTWTSWRHLLRCWKEVRESPERVRLLHFSKNLYVHCHISYFKRYVWKLLFGITI